MQYRFIVFFERSNTMNEAREKCLAKGHTGIPVVLPPRQEPGAPDFAVGHDNHSATQTFLSF